MTRIIAGMLHRIDWNRGEAVIGTETFGLIPGLPMSPDLAPGTGVVALLTERDGARRVLRLRANSAPRFIATAT